MPMQHWAQDRHGRVLQVTEGRRPAGYEIVDTRTNTRRVEELELVNRIRPRVDEWRAANYPGVTSVTRRLLEHWHDREARQYPFYFCQLEAIETLIWWVEAPAEYKQGIYLPGDGGPWERVCNKMATGAGKTTVMGLIIAWQVLNALTYPKRKEFSSAIFIVAPGLTVKERLQVLYPGHEKNVYDEFCLCPNESMRQKINQAALLVENWHTLMPLKAQDRSVVKKGAESDEAFTRRVLDKLAGYKDIIVINDEAHHAYRQRAEVKVSKKEAEELGIDLDEATRWIEGLDRLHKTRRIRRCFDLSATPFAPTGKKSTEKGLFEWIVSDFGLNDAIEAGLVKTPRVVVRDDALANAQSYKSKLYHLYNEDEVKDDLNRKAEPHEPLPDLVQKAYALLAYDWRETARSMDGRRPRHSAGHVDRVQPNRECGAYRAIFQWRGLPDPGASPRHRSAPCGSTPESWRRQSVASPSPRTRITPSGWKPSSNRRVCRTTSATNCWTPSRKNSCGLSSIPLASAASRASTCKT
jgi:type III restriction enzyme